MYYKFIVKEIQRIQRNEIKLNHLYSHYSAFNCINNLVYFMFILLHKYLHILQNHAV